MADRYKFNPLTGKFDLVSVLTIQDVDGTPSGTPDTLKFTNGTVTDNGDGSFTVTIASGASVTEDDIISSFYRALGT